MAKLSTLNSLPLHHIPPSLPQKLADRWWACKSPEKPRDEKTMFDWRCSKCLIKAEAELLIQGDFITGAYNLLTGEISRIYFSRLIELAREDQNV